MTKIEFIQKIIGTQYVNRGYDFNGCDCYGLVYLYYRFVLKNELSITKEYKNYSDFVTSFSAQIKEWEEVENKIDGDCLFVCFDYDRPVHCGVYIGKGQVLHANGNPDTNKGQVVIWRMDVLSRYLERFYGIKNKPIIKYYRPKV